MLCGESMWWGKRMLCLEEGVCCGEKGSECVWWGKESLAARKEGECIERLEKGRRVFFRVKGGRLTEYMMESGKICW